MLDGLHLTESGTVIIRDEIIRVIDGSKINRFFFYIN